MSERATPETDSFVPLRVHHPSLPSWDDYVLVSFARKLERERDEARQELADYKAHAEKVRGTISRALLNSVSEREKLLVLARELRDVTKAIRPFIGYPSTPTDIVCRFINTLAKAKEVLL